MAHLTMRAATLRSSLFRHRFIWALWLALLLPGAQAVAAWHTLTHAGSAVVDSQDAPSALCSLCLAAAALGSAAAPGEPPTLPQSAVPSAVLALAGPTFIPLPARLAYRSRAPPFSPR